MEISTLYPWLNFSLFLLGLIYFLREPLKDFLGDRRESLKKVLEELSQKRRELELRFFEYRTRMEEVGEEIRKLKEELRMEGEIEKQNLIKKSQGYAQKIREDAKRMGLQELTKAKLLLRQKTLSLALTLAKEVLEKSVENEDHERLSLWATQHLEGLKHERTDTR